jgi:flagellin FlaB
MSRLLKVFRRATRKEEGITGLETAIILIAFVVVATVFAFVVLSTGLFSSERGKEAVYSGLQKTRGTLELRGSVVANTDGTEVTTLVFDLANAAGGEPVNVDPVATSNKVVIAPRLGTVAERHLTRIWLVGDGDSLLGRRTGGDQHRCVYYNLGANEAFTLEVKPPLEGTMVIARTTPAGLDTVVDLH